MDKRFLLDTSALFVYTGMENGFETVAHTLNLAKNGKCTVFISFITLTEIYYICWKEKGEDAAKELVVLVKALPVEIVKSSERIALSAGRLKANHKLSLADAIIAATAIDKSAILIHKDPELECISGYTETIKLPYKN